MSVLYSTGYAGRWMVYLVRLVLRFIYSILQFASKPGSRLIVTALLIIAILYWRTQLHEFLYYVTDDAPRGTVLNAPIDWVRVRANAVIYGHKAQWWMLDLFLAGFVLVAWLVYSLLSALLAIVLGAFPKVTAPLPPMRRLEPTKQDIRPATVRSAVPPLRR